MDGSVRLQEVGWRAAAALHGASGRVQVLAVLSESHYVTAGADIVWLGRPGSMLHGRAMIAAGALPQVQPGERVTIDAGGARQWHPPEPGPITAAVEIRAAARALAAALSGGEPPPGFGALIAGASLAFPLHAAAGVAQTLARACAADDPAGAVAAADALIGLGPGLTPSGDDFVGGAFFARACLRHRDPSPADGWARAGAAVLARARERTHPVSLALLGDLMDGHGHASLHDLAVALQTACPPAAALAAARQLARLGHSSGWDMLSGFLAGLGGL
jgi:hypothetical protein